MPLFKGFWVRLMTLWSDGLYYYLNKTINFICEAIGITIKLH